MKVTIKKATSDLQELLDEHGSEDFLKVKALYLKDVTLVNDKGDMVDPEELDVTIGKAEMVDEEDEEMKMGDTHTKPDHYDEEDDEEMAAKSVRKVVKKQLALKAQSPLKAPMIGKGAKAYKGRLKNFKDDHNGDAVDKAIAFGHWLNAQMGIRKSAAFCERNDLHLKAHLEGVNSAGGFLVPEVFETELISLREEHGVARRSCRIRPMTTDVHRIPRRSDTLTPYFVGEAAQITESTQTFEQVSLVAKKLACITTVSSELDEDAFLNISDDIAGEIAYAFAKREDECLFLGDGTSTYGGIEGLNSAMGSAGVVATDEMTSDTLAEARNVFDTGYLTKVMAELPVYADTNRTAWYMHKSTYHTFAQSAALDAGGTTQSMYLGEKIVPQLFGYPVVFVQVMPTVSAYTDTITGVGYFGDMTQAVSFGDRRSTTVQVSEHATINSGNVFEQDEIAIRGTERFDINCHDTGDSSEAGPILRMDLTNAS